MKIERVKTVLLFALVGAGISQAVASFFAPKFIAWYNTPGEGVGESLCNVNVIVDRTISSFVQWQLIGAGIGALMGLILGVIVVKAGAKTEAGAGPEDRPAVPPGA